MQIEDLQEIISKGIQEVGFTDMYLIDVKIKDNKIEIFLDSDEGITFLKCQKLSRWLEGVFDEKVSDGHQLLYFLSKEPVESSEVLEKIATLFCLTIDELLQFASLKQKV